MAVSQMEKISLLFAKNDKDALLDLLQSFNVIEVKSISSTSQYHEDSNRQEKLNLLIKKQEDLERTMERLRPFLPSMSLLKKLRKAEIVLTFDQLIQFGDSNQAQKVEEVISQKIDRLEELEKEIALAQLERNRLLPWKKLRKIKTDFKDYRFLTVDIGTIARTADDSYYKTLLANPNLEIEVVFQSELQYGLMVFSDASQPISLEEFHFEPFEDKGILPALALEKLENQLKNCQLEVTALREQLADSEKDLEQIALEIDYLISRYHQEEAKELLAESQHLSALEGWIEKSHSAHLEQTLRQLFPNNIFLERAEITEKDWDDVPIKLKNHPLVEPFELVTEMYALPKYYEKDPTPILMPFYFTFFGMMVADLGYGLLLTIASLLALKCFTLPKATKRFMTFFMILGISVSIWGCIYGSFFGFNLPFHILSTNTDVMTILLLSVAFGFVTIFVGLVLSGLQHLKMKDYTEAYQSGFAWCLILFGLLLLVIGSALPTFALLKTVGIVLAISNALGILLVSMIQSKSLVGLGSGLFNLYNISAYAGDLVSFTRLMALGLSGASIGTAFNLIVGILPLPARLTVGLVLFILLHAINLFLSLLSGYVHGARLIFVEFFGKFYEGGGKAFQPLKAAEKYTIVQHTKMEDKKNE